MFALLSFVVIALKDTPLTTSAVHAKTLISYQGTQKAFQQLTGLTCASAMTRSKSEPSLITAVPVRDDYVVNGCVFLPKLDQLVKFLGVGAGEIVLLR